MFYPAEVRAFNDLFSDIQKLRDSTDSADLCSIFHELSVSEQDVSHSNKRSTRKKLQSRTEKRRKPACSPSVFFCWFGIAFGVAFGCLICLPFMANETIIFMENGLGMNVSYVRQLYDAHHYKYVKAFRKTFIYLKIRETFSVSNLDVEDCVMDNPIHRILIQDPVDCEYCTNIDQPFFEPVDQTSDEEEEDGSWLYQPTMFQEFGPEMNLKQLQQLLVKNPLMMNSDTTLLAANRPYIKTVEDLMKDNVLDQLLQDPEIHVSWRALSQLSSHILRREFPHPHKVTGYDNLARTFQSMFLIDGHQYPPYDLQPSYKGPDQLCMYVQASGSRRLFFSPRRECASDCHSFTVTMYPKDVVIFPKEHWVVRSESYEESLSLSYIDQIDFYP